MDFEFTKNIFLGGYKATFPMEHLLMGRLLEDELAQDRTKIEQILAIAEQAKLQSIDELIWHGIELTVVFQDYEVQVTENAVYQEIETDLGEDLSLYDGESYASCGLEDFVELITKWREFIKQ
ncbi:YacL family protein [Vibrio viridaestus]|uniref:UPF0231 family protein n=1 Tax=Vibrio viridaestus TaxID=2487322 RepID=A0A3N9THT5_9VIBR|nr:YacL family protein [Vibrio viridaestus]RQW63837.1 UPF0231 family protein [Vibrio viridaestus]